MKNHGTYFYSGDNSGARQVYCIQQSRTSLNIGDTITVSIKKSLPAQKSRVKKGSIYKAVICELKQKKSRFTHLNRSFSRNIVVILNAKGDPIGTRVKTLASFELRARGHAKIASIAPFIF